VKDIHRSYITVMVGLNRKIINCGVKNSVTDL